MSFNFRVFVWTPFFEIRPIIHIGEKGASSTDAAGQGGWLHVEDWN